MGHRYECSGSDYRVRSPVCHIFGPRFSVNFSSSSEYEDFTVRFRGVPTSALNDMRGIELVEE